MWFKRTSDPAYALQAHTGEYFWVECGYPFISKKLSMKARSDSMEDLEATVHGLISSIQDINYVHFHYAKLKRMFSGPVSISHISMFNSPKLGTTVELDLNPQIKKTLTTCWFDIRGKYYTLPHDLLKTSLGTIFIDVKYENGQQERFKEIAESQLGVGVVATSAPIRSTLHVDASKAPLLTDFFLYCKMGIMSFSYYQISESDIDEATWKTRDIFGFGDKSMRETLEALR